MLHGEYIDEFALISSKNFSQGIHFQSLTSDGFGVGLLSVYPTRIGQISFSTMPFLSAKR